MAQNGPGPMPAISTILMPDNGPRDGDVMFVLSCDWDGKRSDYGGARVSAKAIIANARLEAHRSHVLLIN